MTTGWPPGMLQDDSRELSRWLANRPGALYQLSRNDMDTTHEAAFHRAIAPLMNRTLQGRVMGAFRETLAATSAPAAPSEPVAEAVRDAKELMLRGETHAALGKLHEVERAIAGAPQPSAKPAEAAVQERHIEDTQHWTPEPAGAGEAMVTRESAVGALHHMTHGNVPGRFNEAISMLNPPRCDGGTTPAAHAGLSDADSPEAVLAEAAKHLMSGRPIKPGEHLAWAINEAARGFASTPAPAEAVAPEAVDIGRIGNQIYRDAVQDCITRVEATHIVEGEKPLMYREAVLGRLEDMTAETFSPHIPALRGVPRTLAAQGAPSEQAKAFDAFLCRAWGETDLPVAELVTDWEGVRHFMAREWLGEDDAPNLDGESTLDTLKEDFDAHEADQRGGPYSIEFEIGGVSIERVTGFAAQGAPVMAEAASDEQQLHLEQASEMLEDYANLMHAKGQCSQRDGARASAYVLRQMFLAAATRKGQA